MAARSVFLTGFDWTAVVRGVKAMAMAWERRRTVGRLGALDDRLLADIGITRQDVISVLAEPLFVDPSLKLAERAGDARRARRAAALSARSYGREASAPVPGPRRAA